MKLRVPPPGVIGMVLPLAGLVAALVCGALFGIELGLLVAAGGALLGVIALFWGSVQALTGDSPLSFEEALTLGAPSTEEEQKWAVLRALKDLEYERSVGKISDADYTELSARYREEAKRLMAILDASLLPARERAERAVAERLAELEKKARQRNDAPNDEPAGDEPASTRSANDESPSAGADSTPESEPSVVEKEGSQ